MSTTLKLRWQVMLAALVVVTACSGTPSAVAQGGDWGEAIAERPELFSSTAVTIRLSGPGVTGIDAETLLLEDQERLLLADRLEERLVSQLETGDSILLRGGRVGHVEGLRRITVEPNPSATRKRTSVGAPSTRPARVFATVSRQTDTIVRIATSASTITTTPEHPFAKVGSGWTPAAKLSVGDRVATVGEEHSIRILSIRIEHLRAPVRVYNLTVESSHAFYVGPDSLLVHNTPNCSPGRDGLLHINDHDSPSWQRGDNGERPISDRNCAHCQLAGLLDERNVTSYLNRPGNPISWDLYRQHPGIPESLQEPVIRHLGLFNEDTTPYGQFRDRNGTHTLPTRFMKDARENTFYVSFYRLNPETGQYDRGHAVTAIREADGRIRYIDFQEVPPVTTYSLSPNVRLEYVYPTNVDWQHNRQIVAAREHGTALNSFE